MHTLEVNVLDLLHIRSTNQLIENFIADRTRRTAIRSTNVRFGRFWRMWLKPSLETEGEHLNRLVEFIEADIMVSRQVRRRNVLQELTNPGRVDLYFVFDGNHLLNLRLLRPMHDVAEPREEPLAILFEFAL